MFVKALSKLIFVTPFLDACLTLQTLQSCLFSGTQKTETVLRNDS